jgi:hypothetical protein
MTSFGMLMNRPAASSRGLVPKNALLVSDYYYREAVFIVSNQLGKFIGNWALVETI